MISSVFKLSPNFHAFPMLCLQINSWIGNFSSDSCCCCGGWAAEVNFGFRAAHAPDEVAVHRGKRTLARTQQPAMPTNTCTASNDANRAARIMENLNQTVLHRLVVNLHTGRRDNR